jgi:ATP-binding cassette, subfamily B, bacterial HlyB/CyaB
MNRITDLKNHAFSSTKNPLYERLTELWLNLFPEPEQWGLNFSQACTIREFQLGDELVGHDVPDRLPQASAESPGLSIVCQGSVRLLSVDATQQREVSVALLEPGESWGGDAQCSDHPLPYRVIAASAGWVADLPIGQLAPWLQKVPALRDYLQTQVQARQHLIFLKTATALRVHTSHTLKRLLPYLTEVTIAATTPLAQGTPPGRVWLRHGTIDSATGSEAVPAIGDHWGHPDAIPTDWVAATTLSVYHLAIPNWEAAQTIAPSLKGEPDPNEPSDPGSGSQAVGGPPRPPRGNAARSQHLLTSMPANRAGQRDQPQARLPLQSSSAPIEFAQPNRKTKWRWLGQGYPFIPQQSSSDCGAACLAMISQYWGKRFSLNLLRNLAGVGRSGASLKGLANAAENLGFQTRPVRSSFNHLAAQTLPWIAHWQGDHYIVVYRVKRNRVIVADPALGRRSLSLEEFQAHWTGYALLLSPTDMLSSLPSTKPSLGKFWGAFWPYRSMLWSVILASVLLQVFGLVTPLFTQIILDQVVVHKSLPTLHAFIAGLLLFGFWRIGLVATRQYLLDSFSNQVDLTLISGFIRHTLNLPLQFFATRHVGDIITRVQENHKIQLFLTRQAVAAWLDAIMAIFYIGLMVHYNWQLALLVLALLPPIILLTVIASPFLRQVSRQIFQASAQQNSSLVEMLTGIATVKATASERELRWQWEEHLTNLFNAQFRGQKLTNALQVMSGAINTFGSTALLLYGATLVIQDQLSIGQYVAFNMMIGNVIGPVLSLVGLWDELQEVMVSVERLDDIFSAQPEVSPDQSLLEIPAIRGAVAFENVTFRYSNDDDRNILQNITFDVKAGSTIAIVGRSGSGKSTLVNLLQGLYQPTSGRITIDGNDLHHVSPPSFRRQLGVVPQECFLFSGTILDNITLYHPEYLLEQVLEAAKLAEAHGFIQSLPLGYQTKVGERGTMLSGGQRQRIAIARALISDPRILILDEATSSLDTESERRFQKNLQHISHDRTTFIIAHRLSTVRNADCILVLDRGMVVEQGTHTELLAKRGLYAQLAQQQLDI